MKEVYSQIGEYCLSYANLVQKFRLSEENTNVFALLSERNLSRREKWQNKYILLSYHYLPTFTNATNLHHENKHPAIRWQYWYRDAFRLHFRLANQFTIHRKQRCNDITISLFAINRYQYLLSACIKSNPYITAIDI
mgnify:CR=1 FL=1